MAACVIYYFARSNCSILFDRFYISEFGKLSYHPEIGQKTYAFEKLKQLCYKAPLELPRLQVIK